ncbi:MAG: thioredoxin [Bacteroidales bacterium]|nr:thioredoxin [Bacteroidales bacterium]
MEIEITDSNWESVIANELPVIIDFWATWCGPCRAIAPTLEEIAAEYDGKLIVGKINIDENPQVTMNFGIRNIPTLLFFKNGEIVDKHVGVIRKAELVEKINNIL